MEQRMINKYIHLFSHLRTDVNHQRWTSATNYHSPHKPLLLLSVLDLFAQGILQKNLIEITPDLGDIFSKYWSLVMQPEHRGNITLPFFHLRSSPFWHLLPRPGHEMLLNDIHQVDRLSQLQTLVIGSCLDDELFQLMQIEEPRNLLRILLMDTYFAPQYRAILLNQAAINLQTHIYSQYLIQQVQPRTNEIEDIQEQYKVNVRDQGFRRAVIKIYNHRCAVCGVRMLTNDGHSAVDAAHIIPWSVTHNDDPRNGMALCRLCHWTFDEGLISVSANYKVLLSSELRSSLNVPGHLQTLENRPIIGPEDNEFMPAQDAIGWHRRHIFRSL